MRWQQALRTLPRIGIQVFHLDLDRISAELGAPPEPKQVDEILARTEGFLLLDPKYAAFLITRLAQREEQIRVVDATDLPLSIYSSFFPKTVTSVLIPDGYRVGGNRTFVEIRKLRSCGAHSAASALNVTSRDIENSAEWLVFQTLLVEETLVPREKALTLPRSSVRERLEEKLNTFATEILGESNRNPE